MNIRKRLLIRALNTNFIHLLVIYILVTILILTLFKHYYFYNNSSNIVIKITSFYSAQVLTAISMYFLVLGIINIISVDKELSLILATTITAFIFIAFTLSTISFIDPLYTDSIIDKHYYIYSKG